MTYENNDSWKQRLVIVRTLHIEYDFSLKVFFFHYHSLLRLLSTIQRPGGLTCYVLIRGCAIILGTFSGLIPDFWVPFWAILGFLDIMFWLFPDFWVLFFGKI